jgi:ferrous iron transport protein B
VIALVGNPNCGKTTLFNALTGARQEVGNWAGVTVECISGTFCAEGQHFEIVDLPGTYTLTSIEPQGPQDENLTGDFLRNQSYSFVLNIIDALHLERNLYLTLQCLEQNVPMVVALNRMDLEKKHTQKISIHTLSQGLGCKVVPIVAREGTGIEPLKQAFVEPKSSANFILPYPIVIENALKTLEHVYREETGKSPTRYQLLCWLEGEPFQGAPSFAPHLERTKESIATESGSTADVLIATARYRFIEDLLEKVKPVSETFITSEETGLTQWLDKIVCHRYAGLPIFLGVMYSLFFFAINIGGAFQDFFEQTAQAVFVAQTGQWLQDCHAPAWLMALIVSGLGEGLATVVTFIPVIGAMFLALAFLEDCGYMARAAFVVDRLMRAIGLPGKSFVPMIVGFGCNVPAIMGMRTLENKRDRILAVMMSPFMSCGARLAIFTVFVSAFFPHGGQNIVFCLYGIGIFMAILTGMLLKKTVLRGEIAPLLLEMPEYQWPHWRTLWFHGWHRLKRFILNAGKLIVPICMLIGVLNNISLDGKWLPSHHEKPSLLAEMGKILVPVFKPMGIEEENWPAAVGLLTGILAKEVVIGSLNSLYSQPVEEQVEQGVNNFNLIEQLTVAAGTIPTNIVALGQAWQNPILAQAPLEATPHHSYGEMVKRFNGQAAAFAYLLFVLLYFPCISATAAMLREVQRGWTLFSVCWTTGLAYGLAVSYYQIATFFSHPSQSIMWILSLSLLGAGTFLGIRQYGRTHLPRVLPTRIILN